MSIQIEDIKDTTPQSLNKLSRMIRGIVQKVSGNIDFLDLSDGVNQQLFTYPLQPQGEGNLDPHYPMYIRFYVPADVKDIKKAKLNAIISNYRMDSGVAMTADMTYQVSGNTSTGTAGATVSETDYVTHWGPQRDVPHPTTRVESSEDVMSMDYYSPYQSMWPNSYRVWFVPGTSTVAQVAAKAPLYGEGETCAWMDLFKLQHKHKFTLNWVHSHAMNIGITIDGHKHDLEEAIKVSSTSPSGVRIYVNDTQIGNTMNGSNATQNDIDIASLVQKGAWNIIKITSTTVARITVYGIIELSTKISK